MVNKVARIPNLVDWSTGEVRLISSKCNTCGTYFFPKEHYQHRPGCSREGVEDVLLPNKGKLASYTIQHYPCPPPFKTEQKITPYGIGLIEFEYEKNSGCRHHNRYRSGISQTWDGDGNNHAYDVFPMRKSSK